MSRAQQSRLNYDKQSRLYTDVVGSEWLIDEWQERCGLVEAGLEGLWQRWDLVDAEWQAGQRMKVVADEGREFHKTIYRACNTELEWNIISKNK